MRHAARTFRRPATGVGLAHRKDVEPARAARELRRVLLEYVDRAAVTGTLPPGTRLA
jgi:hypothetical protein